jgi:hypothetical protein
MTERRRMVIEQWLQAEDDVLLYVPDTSQHTVSDAQLHAQLREALRMGLISGHTYIRACLAFRPGSTPSTGPLLTREELGA